MTKNFKKSELECECCGVCNMDDTFMEKLQLLRDKCSFGFKINSGYRCEKHNAEVSPNSKNQHTHGLAVDISLKDRYKRYTFLYYALDMGFFKDIAIAKTFIHLGKGNKQNGIGIY